MPARPAPASLPPAPARLASPGPDWAALPAQSMPDRRPLALNPGPLRPGDFDHLLRTYD